MTATTAKTVVTNCLLEIGLFRDVSKVAFSVVADLVVGLGFLNSRHRILGPYRPQWIGNPGQPSVPAQRWLSALLNALP